MKIIYLLAAFVACIASAAPEKPAADNMQSFQWLIGTWEMKTKKGVIAESWVQVSDTAFAGESYMVKNSSEKIPLENVQLIYRNGKYLYIPVALGQNDDEQVTFTITAVSTEGFTAENPEHDFPKRIVYELINKDSVHAYIDGGSAVPEKRSDYYYSRSKN
ncbi:MAG TPA: DUF6265 family protein [Chitinophagaceae bacterium]|nr:DUF6265 family protein [Chitinophagaceae bacterium]